MNYVFDIKTFSWTKAMKFLRNGFVTINIFDKNLKILHKCNEV